MVSVTVSIRITVRLVLGLGIVLPPSSDCHKHSIAMSLYGAVNIA